MTTRNECATCHGTFVPPTDNPNVTCCGRLECRADQTWTADQWEGRARMVDAKLAAGIDPNVLDLVALQRREALQGALPKARTNPALDPFKPARGARRPGSGRNRGGRG